MTVGTAIVLSVGILATAWIITIAIGAWLTNKKQKEVKNIAKTISSKIIENRNNK